MTPTKDVAEMELCEEMARLNLCQDDIELKWIKDGEEWNLVDIDFADHLTRLEDERYQLVAPTLARMMDELPEGCNISKRNGLWIISRPYSIFALSDDKHLPNAVAKALIAIKKGG